MNNVYSGSRMPGTTVQGVPLLVLGTSHKAYRRVLLYALFMMVSEGEIQRSPRSPRGAQVEPEVLIAQHT